MNKAKSLLETLEILHKHVRTIKKFMKDTSFQNLNMSLFIKDRNLNLRNNPDVGMLNKFISLNQDIYLDVSDSLKQKSEACLNAHRNLKDLGNRIKSWITKGKYDIELKRKTVKSKHINIEEELSEFAEVINSLKLWNKEVYISLIEQMFYFTSAITSNISEAKVKQKEIILHIKNELINNKNIDFLDSGIDRLLINEIRESDLLGQRIKTSTKETESVNKKNISSEHTFGKKEIKPYDIRSYQTNPNQEKEIQINLESNKGSKHHTLYPSKQIVEKELNEEVLNISNKEKLLNNLENEQIYCNEEEHDNQVSKRISQKTSINELPDPKNIYTYLKQEIKSNISNMSKGNQSNIISCSGLEYFSPIIKLN